MSLLLKKCPTCQGTPKYGETCPYCDGAGWVEGSLRETTKALRKKYPLLGPVASVWLISYFREMSLIHTFLDTDNVLLLYSTDEGTNQKFYQVPPTWKSVEEGIHPKEEDYNKGVYHRAIVYQGRSYLITSGEYEGFGEAGCPALEVNLAGPISFGEAATSLEEFMTAEGCHENPFLSRLLTRLKSSAKNLL